MILVPRPGINPSPATLEAQTVNRWTTREVPDLLTFKTNHKKKTKKQIIVSHDFGGSGGKESTSNTGDPGSIPGLGRPPGGGNGSPLQYSCWEIPWTEEPGGLQSMGRKGSTERLIQQQL